MTNLARRSLLRAAAAVPQRPRWAFQRSCAASGPEFVFKYGNNLPLTHPLNIRAQEAAERIAKETNGRVEIRSSRTTSSAATPTCWRRCAAAASTSSRRRRWSSPTLVPVAAINAVGFAFADYDQVWKAMDGKLGAHVRAAMAKVSLYTFEKMWDNGFRQITTAPGRSRAPRTWTG